MPTSVPARRAGASRAAAATPAAPSPAQRFWLDDRIIDEIAPALRPHPQGAAALRVYVVLARHANRDGHSWPGLDSIAEHAACSRSTVKRALRLLEQLELVEVTACHDAESRRSTSNLYTLLPPPPVLSPPAAAGDPAPSTVRRIVAVEINRGARLASLTPPDAAPLHPVREAAPAEGASPVPPTPWTPGHGEPLPRSTMTPSPVHGDPLPRVMVTPQEGTPTSKEHPGKEPDGFIELTINDCWDAETEAQHTPDTARAVAPSAPAAPPASPHFVVAEIGLPAPQVWAAALGELARNRAISPNELNAWLRHATLAGRDGATLLLGVPNAATQERVQRRLLPAVRDALSAVLGVSLPVAVVVTP
ncbi:MAG: helix-turn-helix domain-containing protein [Thermomicrobiales bacterium]